MIPPEPPGGKRFAGCGTDNAADRATEGEAAVPIVTVQQSPRDLEVKRRLVAGITEAFVDAYGLAPEHVQVFIQEVGDDNWAKAGVLAADRR